MSFTTVLELIIEDGCNINTGHLLDLYKILIAEDEKQQKSTAIDVIYGILQNILSMKNNKTAAVALYSYIILLQPSEKIVEEFISYVLAAEDISYDEVYFIYTRLSRLAFINPECNTDRINTGLWKLLRRAFDIFKAGYELDLTPIPEEELKGNVQIVLVSQFLGVEHGPTKTALDRAVILKKRFGNALIINTAEVYTKIGKRVYFESEQANYIESLSEQEFYEWKGEQVAYFQCDSNMPDASTMKLLLDTIRNLKPRVCICVGGNSFFAGLVNELIPTLVVGTTQSNLMHTLCDYQIAERHQIEVDQKVIDEVGCRNSLIEGRFTFSIEEPKEIIPRSRYNIPDDSFVICMVGGRLNIEITDDLWDELSKLSKENITIILIGSFGKMDELYHNHPQIADKVIDIGFCSDAVSKIALSDLYVNPVRKGGATSAVEALSLGIPVLTVNYGDVAGSLGQDFSCEKPDDYASYIRKYMLDKWYYENQSKKARILAAKLLDSEKEFNREIDEYLNKRKMDRDI